MSDKPKRCYQVEKYRNGWAVILLDYQRNRRTVWVSGYLSEVEAEFYARKLRDWWKRKGGEVVPE